MAVSAPALNVASIQEGHSTLYVLRWPIDAQGEEDGLLGLCMVLMKREGGFLLGLPSGLIPFSDLQVAAAAHLDAILGAHTVLAVPGVIAGDPGEVVEEELPVLVVDVQQDVLDGMALFDPALHGEAVVLGFSEDVAVLPDAQMLLQSAVDWISTLGEGRLVYYSAEEAEVPETPARKAKSKAAQKEGKAKAAEKAKKSGPQLVAEHLTQLSQIVPAMASQLSHLQEEQKRMFEAMQISSQQVPPRPSQAPISMPVHKFAKLMASPPATSFAKMMGSPPRTKVPPMPSRAAPHQGPQLDGVLGIQEQAEEEENVQGDPLALAVLEQSKALTSLVAQMSQGGDPLLDAGQSMAMGSTSSKGAMGREKLQQDLANRSGDFLLSVLQNAHRRLKPASKIPASLPELASVPGAFWRLRRNSRARHYPVCPGLHHRLCTSGGHQGSPRACCFTCSQPRTGKPRRRSLGISRATSSAGGAGNSGMEPPWEQLSDGQGPCFCTALPTTLGHSGYSVQQGDRLHPQPPAGVEQKVPAFRSTFGTISEEEGQVPKSKRWRRRRNAAMRRISEKEAISACDGRPGMGPDTSNADSVSYHVPERGDKSAVTSVNAAGGHFGSENSDQEDYNDGLSAEVLSGAALIKKELSLFGWANGMLRHLCFGRTSFSFFVRRCLQISRGVRSGTSTALFPLPLPLGDAWCGGLKSLGVDRRYRLALRRVVSLVVMALNFLHYENPFEILPGLRRCPGPCHVAVHDRLIALVKAGGPGRVFSVLGCGRKSFQLDARFEELEEKLQSLGLQNGSAYTRDDPDEVVEQKNDKEELRPYRSLEADRLKLTGRGQWDCRPYLSDLLYMPFVEPRVNLYQLRPAPHLLPDLASVKESEVLKLCRVWDLQGLLRVFPAALGPNEPWQLCKIFNCYKSSTCDRQIGDRRSMNLCEGRISGPSRSLPTAASVLQVSVRRYEQALVGSVTDRRDYYHQFWTTDERSSLNAVHPVLKASQLEGLDAHQHYLENFPMKRRKVGRLEGGDDLGGKPRPLLVGPDAPVVACFGALLQGDHLGVEFACDAHARFLQHQGLLRTSSRLQSSSCISEDQEVQGLVIDDLFVLSKEDVRADEDYSLSSSVASLKVAKDAYATAGILGSDDKDVLGQSTFKVCGAEVISDYASVKRGVTSIGGPVEKRFALAYLTMISAGWPFTSDALHQSVVGSWISLMLLRRPCMSIFNEVFGVVPPSVVQSERPKLRRLSRKAACELQVASILSPIMVSNLAVPYPNRIFATDASMEKGAVVEARVEKKVAEAVWRSADKRGANVPMLSSVQAVLASYDPMFEERTFSAQGPQLQKQAFGEGDIEQEEIPRPLGLRFQFLEVCGGSGVVTHELLKLGVVCGPVLDLSTSRQFNLCEHRVVEWVLFLLEDDRLDSVMIAPPCTSYSPAAFPCVRSYRQPRGFDQSNEKVRIGNLLAFATLAILMVCLRLAKMGLAEQPRRSKMRWLMEWQRLLKMGAEETYLASCSYGSIHQKEFALISANMKVGLLHRPCTKDHQHVKIEGKWTKPSAVYCEGLSRAFANFYKQHLDAMTEARIRLDLAADGLEDILSNDLLMGLSWKEKSSWKWRGSSHINILELAAYIRMLRHVAEEGGDERIPFFIDSHVARCCISRGRSSAGSLRRGLQKAAALCLAYGLYPAGKYSPTRMNPADCPTRNVEIPPPVALISSHFSSSQLTALATISGLKRWAANWCRLALLLVPAILDFRTFVDSVRVSPPFPMVSCEWHMDFDATLGYPGEGPCSAAFLLGCMCWIGLPLSVVAVGVSRSHGDAARKAARSGIVLEEGRRTTELTAVTRDLLYGNFLSWLEDRGVAFDDVLFCSPPDVDQLNRLLCDFGRWLFREGKPYYHFSETINAITCKRPLVRRSLQQSWDLAFMWGSHEPAEHHIAMPYQILIALIAGAWSWGWKREAACFALAWGALLRIGEILAAKREDLVLPSDIGNSVDFVLLRIKEPKTRYRAARHQAGKLEQADLIEVVRIGFADLKPFEMLWNFSGSTLRLRLQKLLEKLDLPSKNHERPKALSLASFRPGGATHLMSVCESAELVRRRGRWASFRVMEIYLQEVAANTYLNVVVPSARAKVFAGLDAFPMLFQQVRKFDACKIPAATWYFLLSHVTNDD